MSSGYEEFEFDIRLLADHVQWKGSPNAAIREGFPHVVVAALMRASGLTFKELAGALDLSPRSLERRRRTGRLARFESDRLYRLARTLALARQSLGQDDRAVRWLKRSNRALGGFAPIAAMDTQNWGPVRSRISWDASPTAESVDSSLPDSA